MQFTVALFGRSVCQEIEAIGRMEIDKFMFVYNKIVSLLEQRNRVTGFEDM